MFSEKLREYTEKKYQERLPFLGSLIADISRQLSVCTEEEQLLMKFLYGTMPIRDAGEYDFTVFFSYVKHSLAVYQTLEWCKGIPEDIFLHDILYYRINSENIEDCRRFFYDQLIGRIRGLSVENAVLEINYWCAENGSYEASDRRTISPLTFYRSGKGRCGEESTFAVTAFRSVGIPARQVYTPRWAHCDDNHAWVEVYLHGTWHFLGACEPEEILDRGWFCNASSRALLVHSRTFSDYMMTEDSECLGREEILCYYNHTASYARTGLLTVIVTDRDGTPEEGASVSVQILNASDYFDAAVLHTDSEGKASITLGLGTVRLLAEKDGRRCEKEINVKEKVQISLELVPLTDHYFESGGWITFDVAAPADFPVHPHCPTRQQKERNRARIRESQEIRETRIAGYYCAGKAAVWPEEQEILRLAAGNFDEIYRFLGKDDNPDRKALLHTLSKKDYKDARADILESHLASAGVYRGEWEKKGKTDIYERWILCPRIYYEELTPYRDFISQYFTREEKAVFAEDPMVLWETLRERIAYDASLDYSTIFSTPTASLRLMRCNPFDRKILFIAICRTLGIPARIDPVSLTAEFYWKNDFVRVCEQTDIRKDSGNSASHQQSDEFSAALSLVTDEKQIWQYYCNWTIGRWDGSRFRPLMYRGLELECGCHILWLRPGKYRILTSNRLLSGNQLVAEYRFTINSGEHKKIKLLLREGKVEEMFVSYPLEEFDVRRESSEPVSAASLFRERTGILAILSVGEEPTEHFLNELLAQREILRECEFSIWFMLPDKESLENRTLQDVRNALPQIQVLYGDTDELAESLARRMYVEPGRLPLLLAIDSDFHGIFASSGYCVGSVGLLLKLLKHKLQNIM